MYCKTETENLVIFKYVWCFTREKQFQLYELSLLIINDQYYNKNILPGIISRRYPK